MPIDPGYRVPSGRASIHSATAATVGRAHSEHSNQDGPVGPQLGFGLAGLFPGIGLAGLFAGIGLFALIAGLGLVWAARVAPEKAPKAVLERTLVPA